MLDSTFALATLHFHQTQYLYWMEKTSKVPHVYDPEGCERTMIEHLRAYLFLYRSVKRDGVQP